MAASPAAFRITVTVMPRSARILTWLMLLMLIGGHWGVLQVVAWTGMLIDYSRDATFAEAWDKTFDGEHPCALCVAVDCGLAADGGAQAPDAPGKWCKLMKLDAVVTAMVLATPVPSIESWLPIGWPAVATGMNREPPRRPPRVMG